MNVPSAYFVEQLMLMRKRKVFSILEEYFGEKEKCFRKNSVAHILFEMGEVEKC